MTLSILILQITYKYEKMCLFFEKEIFNTGQASPSTSCMLEEYIYIIIRNNNRVGKFRGEYLELETKIYSGGTRVSRNACGYVIDNEGIVLVVSQVVCISVQAEPFTSISCTGIDYGVIVLM